MICIRCDHPFLNDYLFSSILENRLNGLTLQTSLNCVPAFEALKEYIFVEKSSAVAHTISLITPIVLGVNNVRIDTFTCIMSDVRGLMAETLMTPSSNNGT